MILSIIIPVFNEEKTIGEILKKVFEVKLPHNIQKEIIVVDDGSTDSTAKILNDSNKKGVFLLKHNRNLGKGSAIITGLTKATGDFLIIQDADLEYNPQDYTKLLQPILKNKTKVVYGTRLVNYPLRLWGENKTILPLHLLANRFLTWMTNLLYGVSLTDMETCYKLFEKDVIKKINLQSKGFDFEPEITAKILKQNIHISEVPISIKPRTYQEGKKISWRDGLIALWTLIKYRLIN